MNRLQKRANKFMRKRTKIDFHNGKIEGENLAFATAGYYELSTLYQINLPRAEALNEDERLPFIVAYTKGLFGPEYEDKIANMSDAWVTGFLAGAGQVWEDIHDKL